MSNANKQRLCHLLIRAGSITSGVLIAISLAPLIFWIPPLRVFIYRICITTNWWKGKYELILKVANFAFYSEIIVGLPLLSVTLLGINHLLDGIVASGFFVAFFAFQYHKMFSPNFAVTYTTVSADDKSYNKSLEGGKTETIYFSFTNIGLIHLKGCGSHIEFDTDFKVKGASKYVCTTTSGAKRIQFKPDVFHLELPPFESQQMMAIVQIPNQEGIYPIEFALYSESTWGTAKCILKLAISNEKQVQPNIIQDNGAL